MVTGNGQLLSILHNLPTPRKPAIAATLQYILRSDNPEKVPDSAECSTGGSSHPACAPGFFEMIRPTIVAAPSAFAANTKEVIAQSGKFHGPELTIGNGSSAGRHSSTAASLILGVTRSVLNAEALK